MTYLLFPSLRLFYCLVFSYALSFSTFTVLGLPGEELPLRTVWGPVTNGVKGGLIFYQFHDGRPGRIEAFIAPTIESASLTNGQMFNVPDKKYLFAIRLKPIVGKEPRLTAHGQKFRNVRPPPAKVTERDRSWVTLRNEFPRFLSSFHITDYFTFESNGLYELEVGLTLYQARKSERVFGVFTFPPVRTHINVVADKLEGLRTISVESINE